MLDFKSLANIVFRCKWAFLDYLLQPQMLCLTFQPFYQGP